MKNAALRQNMIVFQTKLRSQQLKCNQMTHFLKTDLYS